MKKKIEVLLNPYISILFLRDIKAGGVVFLLSFLIPSVGVLGLVAIISTIIFAEFISLRDEYIKQGFYLYNSLLVGMGIGYYFDITFNTIVLTTILSVFTFLLSFGLNKIFFKYSLPILSLPFAFVSMIFYLASLKYNSLLSNMLHRVPLFDIDMVCSPFFKSIGTIFFLPYNIAGLIISIIILFYSRIMFLMAVIGFYVGVFIHSIFVPYYSALNSNYNFNFILISVALGGFFLVANLKNYILAIIGVIVSVVLLDSMEVFFNTYLLPVYTMPFNIVVLLFLMLLVSIPYKDYNYIIKESPEKSLSYFLSQVYRFGGNGIKIALPFTNRWSVYQGFDGKWTHKGKWRYAYDFVIKKGGKTYNNEGLYLDDYYAFGQTILSPINGYVIAFRGDLVDNFIGSVDRINNWGNYIILKSDYGYFVKICHLMQNSISLKIGDYVQTGQILGRCGNSGYSPEPHIHIQVQKYGVLGSETLPFKFIDYLQNDKLYFYNLPKIDEEIEATIQDKSMQLRLNFILDDRYKYIVYKDKEKFEEIEFVVNMNDNGEFYLSDGKNRLYFYSYDKLFYFYEYEGGESYLKELFRIAPKIPLINKTIEYSDTLPLSFRFKGLKLAMMEFLLSFNHKLFDKQIVYKKENLEISSPYGIINFNFYEKGFEKIVFKNLELRREYEKTTTDV